MLRYFAIHMLRYADVTQRRYIEKVAGALLVITGILFLTGGINAIDFWLQEMIPAFSEVG